MQTAPWNILVVEDDILIAIDIQAVLEGAGHRVMGPATSLSAATDLLGRGFPHVALLDISLRGSNAFALADFLVGVGTTVIFLSGHSRAVMPEEHRHRRLISKPFLPVHLLEAVVEEMRGKSQPPS